MREHLSIHDKTKGRWPGILSTLGIGEAMLNVRKHHPCLWCGGKDRFRFTNQNDSGRFYCGQCGSHSAIDVLMVLNNWDFQTAALEVEKVVGDVPPVTASKRKDFSHMHSLWSSSLPLVKGDFVDAFFNRRGINMSRFPLSLRKLARSEHVDEEKRKTYWPTMVAQITKPNGEATNLHRTFLTDDGLKASVADPRKMMPGSIEPGSSVKLYGPRETMGIAEGIETALSASILFRMPVWASLNTSLMKTWEAPDIAKKVIIFADNDSNGAGQVAAYTLLGRLKTKGIDASVEIPSSADDDWNDILSASLGIPA